MFDDYPKCYVRTIGRYTKLRAPELQCVYNLRVTSIINAGPVY